MRIAVIGGNGFIGRELVKCAAEKGHTMTVIGSDCDVFALEGEERALKILQSSDAMIFLAVKRPVTSFSFDEYSYNIRLFEKYVWLAKAAKVENIVITSSRTVYSSDRIPWREDEFDTPLSLYGASKQAIDALTLLYNKEYGLKIKSLRLAQVLGLGEKKGFLLNTFIDNAVSGRKLTIYGKGIGRRQYIYIKDVCDAILHCVESQRDVSGIYNIGMENNVSITELAGIVNEVFENTAGIECIEDKPEDTKEYLMDVTKAATELKWKPEFGLREALTDIKNSMRSV